MLKKAFKENVDLITNLFISSEDTNSDTDFVFDKILNIESLANINDIIDLESVEYKPINDTIEFDIFFLRYLLNDELNQIKNYIEKDFSNYSDQVLKLDTSVKSEFFEIRNNDDLIVPQYDGTLELTRSEINDSKPYVVIDPMVELRKRYPTKQGHPYFYNTFSFPFWDKRDVWDKLKYGFNNKTYTYNSFLIIEIYDTYEVEKQKKITTIPVYVSDRYLFNEKTETRTYNVLDELGNIIESVTTEGIVQKRPVFNLSEGIDGYSFFFIKKYIKSDFYVKFYFWDALNGKKIQFIPSGKNNFKKKWLQDVEIFDQKKLYLKYELDFENKKYKIFDLNDTTNKFDVEIYKIDLYEFAFDDYWSNFFVKNVQPSNVSSTVPTPVYNDILPFKQNVIGAYYLIDTKYLTVKDGLLKEKEVIDVEIETEVELNNNQAIRYVSAGNYYGFFLQKVPNLEVKTIGLLNIRDIKCGITDIRGSKRTIESIKFKNVNTNKSFIINNIVLENIDFSSNEKDVDLLTKASFSYEIQNLQTQNNLYTETHVLPKTANRNPFSYFDKLFYESFEKYKQNIASNKSEIYNKDVYNNLYQRIFANMSVLEADTNPPKNVSGPGDEYDSKNLLDKLKTQELFKEQTIALTATTSSKKLSPQEEMFISLDLVFGRLALFYSGIIKEIGIKGSLIINYTELDNPNPTVNKITIPININLK